MKYEVSHSFLISSDPKGEKKDVRFARGDAVTAQQLTDAGFDLDHLLANGAIEEMRGSKDEGPTQPTTTADAKPGDATAPAATRYPRENTGIPKTMRSGAAKDV